MVISVVIIGLHKLLVDVNWFLWIIKIIGL